MDDKWTIVTRKNHKEIDNRPKFNSSITFFKENDFSPSLSQTRNSWRSRSKPEDFGPWPPATTHTQDGTNLERNPNLYLDSNIDSRGKSLISPDRSKLGLDLDLDVEKINEPCWFYNTIGCKNKDGTEKSDKECKYLHIKSENVKRPAHLVVKKPCDKYNLEGSCKWGECCKYSHKPLDAEEWLKYYPDVPFSVKTGIQKRQVLENKITELESRVKILEYKIKCMDEFVEKFKI